MTLPTKKIIYISAIVIGICAIILIIGRASYETSFLSPTAPPSLVSVSVPVAAAGTPSQIAVAPEGTTTPPAVAVQPTVARLSIPSIKLNAAIESVGLTSNGNMDTPIRLADVGWYENGTAIGDVGSAVIDGHVDDSLALPAVFYNLKNVQENDDIYVTTSTGTQLHFVVTAIDDYSVATAPLEDIFNDRSGDRLIKLITCEGTWDSGRYSYDHRIVVTAKLVQS